MVSGLEKQQDAEQYEQVLHGVAVRKSRHNQAAGCEKDMEQPAVLQYNDSDVMMLHRHNLVSRGLGADTLRQQRQCVTHHAQQRSQLLSHWQCMRRR
jgi:hypothetical protein